MAAPHRAGTNLGGAVGCTCTGGVWLECSFLAILHVKLCHQFLTLIARETKEGDHYKNHYLPEPMSASAS